MTRHQNGNHDNAGGFVDGGFIPNGNASLSTTPRVYRNDANQAATIESVDRVHKDSQGRLFEAPVEGDGICSSGITTGQTCGEVGPRNDFPDGYGGWLLRVPCATTLSDYGDSGAGMYFGVAARGVNWGKLTVDIPGVCTVENSVFTPIARVENALGVTVNAR